MRDHDHLRRRGYDRSAWPVKTDGNGNYLIDRRNTYVSLALLMFVVAGSMYATWEAATLRSALNYSVEQSALASLEFKGLREDQRELEKLVSNIMGEMKTQIAVLESRMTRLERIKNAAVTISSGEEDADRR